MDWLAFILGMSRTYVWPTIVLIVILRFGPKIGPVLVRWLDRREVTAEGLGFKLGLGPAVETTAALEEAVIDLSEPPAAEVDQPQAQRAKIEALIRTSAAWGWAMAQVGFKSAPVPEIAWDGDVPKIRFGRTPSFLEYLRTQEDLEQMAPDSRPS